MYDPNYFYEEITDKLRPGDILHIKNWDAIEDSYWSIITSFCDLNRRDHLILSKIRPMDSIQNINEGQRGNIRSYRILYYFYLPPIEDEFPESIVHYGKLLPFSRQILEQARTTNTDCRHVKSLSIDTRRLFQFHFANHFTRDETLELFKPHIEGLVKTVKKHRQE